MQKKNFLLALFLFFSIILSAQNINQFLEQEKAVHFQKIYLHTDRELYFQGDTLWFASYLVDGQTHIPSTENCNLYVELINKKGEIAQSNIFKIENGTCPGYLSFSGRNVKEGKYLLRAYTDYIKNFGDDAYFTKTIQISKVKNFIEQDKRDSLAVLSAEINISILPEGGFLLADNINAVAFKAINKNGQGVNIDGNLLDESGKSIYKFSTLYKGMGLFYFIPKANSKYKIEIEGYPNLEVKLPEIRTTGAKLLITKQDEHNVTFSIISNKQNENTPFHLCVMHRGLAIYYSEIDNSKVLKSLKLKTKLLKEGINRFVLLDHNFNPLSERLVFLKNNMDKHLDINLSKTDFSTRDKVSFQIKNKGSFLKNENAKLSISVFDENSANASGISQNIKSYLLIDSELNGAISSPADYFVDDGKIRSNTKLNLLMLVNGWKNYVWNNLKEDEIEITQKPQLGITLKGKIKTPNQKKVLQNSEVVLGLSYNENMQMFSTNSDTNGNFEFKNIQFYDSATVFIQGKKGKNNLRTHLELDSPFYNPPAINQEPIYYLNSSPEVSVSTYRSKYINELRLKEFYPDRNSRVLEDIEVKAKKPEPKDSHFRFYGEPTRSLKITNKHSSFPSVLLFIKMYFLHSLQLNGPKFYINGTEVSGTKASGTEGFTVADIIESLTMSEIDRIEAIYGAKGAILGFDGRRGAIFIFTKNGGEREVDTGPVSIPGTIVKRIKGFTSSREFYSPKYTAKNIESEVPDFRTTLYWNPNVTFVNGKADISFFTCDNFGRYKIFIEGISNTGKICFGSGEFEVNQKRDTQDEL